MSAKPEFILKITSILLVATVPPPYFLFVSGIRVDDQHLLISPRVWLSGYLLGLRTIPFLTAKLSLPMQLPGQLFPYFLANCTHKMRMALVFLGNLEQNRRRIYGIFEVVKQFLFYF